MGLCGTLFQSLFHGDRGATTLGQKLRSEGRKIMLMRYFQFQHHDGDDDGHHPIRKRLYSSFGHLCLRQNTYAPSMKKTRRASLRVKAGGPFDPLIRHML